MIGLIFLVILFVLFWAGLTGFRRFKNKRKLIDIPKREYILVIFQSVLISSIFFFIILGINYNSRIYMFSLYMSLAIFGAGGLYILSAFLHTSMSERIVKWSYTVRISLWVLAIEILFLTDIMIPLFSIKAHY